MALPDPRNSRVLLVGVSDYPRMAPDRQLPTVRAGLHKLGFLLQDDRVWGLPEANCVILDQPENADTVVSALRKAADEARDALVFYYAGHGLVDPAVDGGELHLALPSSYEPGGTHLALGYAHIRREFKVKPGISRKVVILDCCWSGKALGTTMGASEGLVAATAIAGSAVLTATAATKTALAPANEPFTAFTGAFLRVLEDGIPGKPGLLDIGTIHQHLDAVLAGQGRPRPRLGGTECGSHLPLVRNRALRPTAEREPTLTPPAGSVTPAASAIAGVRLLRRLGNYAEAAELQQAAIDGSDPTALRDRAAELRRTCNYEQAESLDHFR